MYCFDQDFVYYLLFLDYRVCESINVILPDVYAEYDISIHYYIILTKYLYKYIYITKIQHIGA